MSYFGKYQVSYFGRRPAKPSGANIMTRHSAVLEVDRPIPVDDTVKDLQPGTNDKASAGELAFASPVVKKFNFRRLLTAGVAEGGVAGSAGERLGHICLPRDIWSDTRPT